MAELPWNAPRTSGDIAHVFRETEECACPWTDRSKTCRGRRGNTVLSEVMAVTGSQIPQGRLHSSTVWRFRHLPLIDVMAADRFCPVHPVLALLGSGIGEHRDLSARPLLLSALVCTCARHCLIEVITAGHRPTQPARAPNGSGTGVGLVPSVLAWTFPCHRPIDVRAEGQILRAPTQTSPASASGAQTTTQCVPHGAPWVRSSNLDLPLPPGPHSSALHLFETQARWQGQPLARGPHPTDSSLPASAASPEMTGLKGTCLI
ncbi:uncharacterized protein LOC141583101 [Saimiri boliviensis]|uniref:uncharacterized protein LOC141583101 n=1 Tax=Saimiri boliviensis TaxID=27679 RepID=UPI003D774752